LPAENLRLVEYAVDVFSAGKVGGNFNNQAPLNLARGSGERSKLSYCRLGRSLSQTCIW